MSPQPRRSAQPLERMHTPVVITDAPNARRPLAVWVLLLYLAVRITADLHSLIPGHALAAAGPAASRSYGLYLAAISLTIFRAATIVLVMFLVWRRHWVGLVIAAILVFSELYYDVLQLLTGGGALSAFGPPATEGDAIARAVGRYTIMIAPLALLAWCSLSAGSRRYFRHAL